MHDKYSGFRGFVTNGVGGFERGLVCLTRDTALADAEKLSALGSTIGVEARIFGSADWVLVEKRTRLDDGTWRVEIEE